MDKTKKEDGKNIFFKIFWYSIVFSIIGLLIETMYCFLTTGVLESRKGLIWGPFCPVYGVGGTLIILLLNKYKDNKFKLFLFGMILGGVIEYSISYILEAIYGIRFWEYSYLYSNLNGRICLIYSIFWGALSLFIIMFVKPKIDILIEKIPYKEVITIAMLIFITVDVVVTVWGINTYKHRAKNIYFKTNLKILDNIQENYFTNERMKKNFPNLRIITDDKKEVFVRDII